MTAAPLVVRERVVGMAAFGVSADPNERLVTHALGASIAVTVHDPVQRVGGVLHAMLPSGELDPEQRREHPARFVDAGIPLLVRAIYELGGVKSRLVVKVAGGAWDEDEPEDDQVGKRNVVACRELLQRNGVTLGAEDVGGARVTRTVMLDIASGDVTVRSGTRQSLL
ncbi:MAG: chemotaxis protein CheD [Gemmatimonadetes bacterium]|nr:chemotaxis protein CheD [Gemmatimonadota bacterium]